MSEMEYNKGRLVPTGADTEHFTDQDWETYFENGFAEVDGEIYEVVWEVEGGELDELAEVRVNDDDSISFQTYHYNGYAHWTEVVTKELEKKYSEVK